MLFTNPFGTHPSVPVVLSGCHGGGRSNPRRSGFQGKKFLTAVAIGISVCAQAKGEVIEDANIRTWTHSFTSWNMEDNQYRNLITQLPSSVQVDKILGARVTIYSDEATPEVFNLSRLGNMRSQQSFGSKSNRAGGWADVQVASDRWITIWLDRGRCDRSGSSACSGEDVESFFAAKSIPNGSPPRRSVTFPYAPYRVFYSEAKTRGVIKIDYACSNCVNPVTNVFWKKLGPWNMTDNAGLSFSQASLGVNPSGIADMSATIYSDPMPANGKIIVDDLEHSGTKPTEITGDNPSFYGRGGFLWFGKGCFTSKPNGCASDHDYSASAFRVYTGPAMTHPSTYRSTGFNYEGPFDNVEYNNNVATPNRGWLRVEYTGSKSAVKVPYAFKSKAVSLGNWPMQARAGHNIGFSQFGVAANRIGRITTTIRSNQFTFDGTSTTYYRFSNFYRPKTGTHNTIYQDDPNGGGLGYIDEGRGIVAFKHGAYNLNWQASHYYNSDYNSTDNRGYVLIDYLAGSCEGGLTGYKIQAVPGTQVGDCEGTSPYFAVEGAGRGTPTAAFNTTDSLTYVYKSSTAANLTVSVRVEAFDASTAHASALAGVLFRAALNSNSRNAAMMALHGSNAVSFRRRLNDGNATTAEAGTAPQYMRWVRIQKTGNTFKGFMHTANTSTIPATGWTQVGPTVTISFPSTYYYGLQVSNFDSPKLTKATMRNLSVQ
jgi:hypothetical protein